MKTFDKIFGAVTLGLIILVSCFCAGWWTAYALHLDAIVFAIAGALTGILLNRLFLMKLVARLYRLKMWTLVLIMMLYTVGILGFFMGVPVFNVAVGVIAGIYVGRQAKIMQYDNAQFLLRLRRAQLFSFAALLFVCVASAYFALSDPYTAANLEGMFALDFAITFPMLIGLIVVGGLLLIGLQYLFTSISARLVFRKI